MRIHKIPKILIAKAAKKGSPFRPIQSVGEALSSSNYAKSSGNTVELCEKAESGTATRNSESLGMLAASVPGRMPSYPKTIVHRGDIYSQKNHIEKAATRIKQEIFRSVFPSTNGIPPAKTKLAIFFIAPSCNGKSTLKKGFDPNLFLKMDHSHKIASEIKNQCEKVDYIEKEDFIHLVKIHETDVFRSKQFQKFCIDRLPDIIEKEPLQKEDSIESKLVELKAIKHEIVLQSFASTGSNIMIDLRAANMNDIRAQREQLTQNGYTCVCVSPVVGDNEELKRRWQVRNSDENKKDLSDLVRVLGESEKFKETGFRELEKIFNNNIFVVQTDAKKNTFEVVSKDNLPSLGFGKNHCISGSL